MRIDILFWFYKEPDICINRLDILRKTNPDARIFGLFGGDPKDSGIYQERLGPYLDDYYTTSFADRDPEYKWIHGDLMLLDWYEQRGKQLAWEHIAIVQWDMLVFDSFDAQFPDLPKDHVFLSGLRKLDAATENRWHWTRPDGEERANFLAFTEYVANTYAYTPESFWCCLFILEIFPRLFFEKWGTVPDKEIGMLEYTIPTYADIFDIPFYQKDIGVWWGDRDETIAELPLNATGTEVDPAFVRSELAKPDGYRIFHPSSASWDSVT